jgi:glycosyltransferase involved in cell wall biosynthesis
VDFFAELQRVRPGFHVIFTAAEESDRQFAAGGQLSFSHEILGGGSSWTTRLRKDWHRHGQLWARLKEHSPQLLVIGGSYLMPDARLARGFAIWRQVPWVYWGENPFKRGRLGMRARLRSGYLRWFLRDAAGAIGVGTTATRHYEQLLPGRAVANVPYAPVLQPLVRPSPATVSAAEAYRARLLNGSTQGVVVMFCGSLDRRKAPDVLLEAFAAVTRQAPQVHLLLVGDGPMRLWLAQRAVALGLAHQVSFAGFVQGEELRQAYLASDIFVLPTRGHEGWGVVVQEAMAAGLAVIVSDRVGAGADLIDNGRSGLVFPADDVRCLTQCLVRLCQQHELRARLGLCGQRHVAATDASSAVRKMLEYLDSIRAARSAEVPSAGTSNQVRTSQPKRTETA